MSHIVSVQTEVRDATAVRSACKRLGLAEPVLGITRLFQGEVNGLAVQFPGWQYPVVADLATGQLKFDDFGGRWGNRRDLDRFLQIYAAERVKIEAHRKGYGVSEQQLHDGSIKLSIQVNGGAA